MKKFAKVIISSILISTIFLLVGCSNKEEHIGGNLEDIMSKVYASIPEDERPMYLENIEINDENIKNYIGTDEIEYDSALASESMVTSMAHSVVLVRMKDIKDVEDAKTKIKESVDPRKWVCVGVENVRIESRGDLIIVILDDEQGEMILEDFKKLETE